MDTPLYSALIKYSEEKKSFHMPGHKFGKFEPLKDIDMTLLDATEASGLDNLYEADAIIKEAMCLMAKFYGAKESIFLTNGSTAGILASILYLCRPGDEIIVARNCHHSVWSALILSGAIPIYVDPVYDRSKGMIRQIEVEAIEEAMALYPNCKGAIIVSPTYEGFTSPIGEIAHSLHQQGKALIVDEAHGAHFTLYQDFPKTALEQGADIVINSMHKTLPTLTQSGLVHFGTDNIDKQKFIECLKMIQTSSPSYLLMGTMDYIRAYLTAHKQEIQRNYLTPLEAIRKQLMRLKSLKLIDEDKAVYDISKIIISTKETNITGYELAKWLEEKYQIVVEAALPEHIILITTLVDTKESLKELQEALLSLDDRVDKVDKELNRELNREVDKVEEKELELEIQNQQSYFRTKTKGLQRALGPREVHFSEHEWINLEWANGRVAAKSLMLYPPGIPVIAVGEKIDLKSIQMIKGLKDKILGLDATGELIQVVKLYE